MADSPKLVNVTVDGKAVSAPAGTLLIEACKTAGIEVPAFCYYPNLSLQGACRMCLVRVEKMPKLQTACTTGITDGMVVVTDSGKFGHSALAHLCPLDRVHRVVVDAGIPDEWKRLLTSAGIALTIAEV